MLVNGIIAAYPHERFVNLFIKLRLVTIEACDIECLVRIGDLGRFVVVAFYIRIHGLVTYCIAKCRLFVPYPKTCAGSNEHYGNHADYDWPLLPLTLR